MKKTVIIILSLIIFNSCNKIPDKTVFEKLSVNELSKAINSDPLFADFYKHVRYQIDYTSDIKMATYYNVTYRRLFKYVKFLQDTTYWSPVNKQLEQKWVKEYGVYRTKADSILNYMNNKISKINNIGINDGSTDSALQNRKDAILSAYSEDIIFSTGHEMMIRKIIREVLKKQDYMEMSDFLKSKKNEIKENKDRLCFHFIKEMRIYDYEQSTISD